jgi:hypothetical protein
MRSWLLVSAGAAAGIALVLAIEGGCGAGSDATAGPADCTVWQVSAVHPLDLEDDPETLSGNNIETLPAGWEPYAYDSPMIRVRRCKP